MIDKSPVLVLAPHTDDGELGCGGLISVCVKNGTSLMLSYDPIHDLIKSGNWKKSMADDLQDWLKFYVDSKSKSFNSKPLRSS